MSAEENKDLVRRFFEARAETDLDELDEMLAPDFVCHTRIFPGQPPGREGYKWSIAQYSAAFSNRRFIVEDQVAEADKVWTRFSVRATHD
jgi:ketosteroid isomerase-like protein